jgi:hypothetical protein
VLQPIAATSACTLLVAAIGVVVLARRFRRPGLNLLGAAAAMMAAGTAVQHSTGTWMGMWLDHAGLQATNVVMVLFALRRWRRWPWARLVRLGTLGWLAVLALIAADDAVRRLLFVAGTVPSITLEVLLWRRDGWAIDYRWWGVGWGLFGLAIAAWALDRSAAVCDPTGVLQLHALWHALCAAALGSWARWYTQFDALGRAR